MENKIIREDTGYFPLFVDIRDKKILIAGGGTIAQRRAETLVKFGACITVIAPVVSEGIKELASQGRLNIQQRPYETGDCQGAWMVLAATDDPQINEQVCREGKEAGALVNNASGRTQCDFYFPGIIKKGEAVIGINAGGRNHKRAKELRIRIEKSLE